MIPITVIGAGPAGSAAAISAALEGASVDLRERSRFPRHKVCGEFVSPEILPLLSKLGVERSFLDAAPARVRRLELHFGARTRSAALPEPAFGLSRYVFDQLLLDRALAAGVALSERTVKPPAAPTILAHGRQIRSGLAKGDRIFGFKAHYEGPASDAIELHFFEGGYVGVNAIEAGRTNICGLANEAFLKRIGFEYDELVHRVPSLNARVRPLRRAMDWLSTGPLVFANQFETAPQEGVYPAGDALSFVDPFTGSGMYCAALTGTIAGLSAARQISAQEHLDRCRQALGRPFRFASLIRKAVASGLAARLAPLVPSSLLYRLTRPAPV